MPSEQEIELAHPEAFDFVFGNLPSDATAEFNDHLEGCRYCQRIVSEYSEIGRIVQSLPPHVEPPADLEDRTVAAVLDALADQPAKAEQAPQVEDQAATRTYQVPEQAPPPPAPPAGELAPTDSGPPTQVHQVPEVAPASVTRISPAEPEPEDKRPGGTGAKIIRFPHWGRPGLYVAAAAAVIIAVVAFIVPTLTSAPAEAAVSFDLRSPTGQAGVSGTATDRLDATGSWDVTLNAHGLKNLGPVDFYQCWYVTPDHSQRVSAGTFVVTNSGSGTWKMTSGVDPRQFKTMQIVTQAPNGTGAKNGTVVLVGQERKVS